MKQNEDGLIKLINPSSLPPAGGADHGAAAGAGLCLHAALGAELQHRPEVRLPPRERSNAGGV